MISSEFDIEEMLLVAFEFGAGLSAIITTLGTLLVDVNGNFVGVNSSPLRSGFVVGFDEFVGFSVLALGLDVVVLLLLAKLPNNAIIGDTVKSPLS